VATTSPTHAPISRDDIEAKLRQIRQEVRGEASAAAPVGLAVAGLAVIAVLSVAYLLGRRRGRIRSAVVEIRRI
jgi:hypothetical protein